MFKKNVKKSNFEVERRRKFEEFQEKCRSRRKRKSTATEEFTSEGECAQGTGQQNVLIRQEFVTKKQKSRCSLSDDDYSRSFNSICSFTRHMNIYERGHVHVTFIENAEERTCQ